MRLDFHETVDNNNKIIEILKKKFLLNNKLNFIFRCAHNDVNK